ncbi:MAG: GPP34 family phosphoprotein, partial [Myxococcales bacterium]|nr:GPP34 family phosphoprotein [Myxococcales bacterium]
GRPDSLLEPAEHCLSSRPTPVVDLLDRIAAEDLRHTVCSHLVGMGALTVKTQRRWFRTVSSRWPTADPAIEEALRAHVRDHIARTSGPPVRTDTLVVLLDVAGLLGTIFGEDVPTERIDERTSDLPWRRHLRDWSERHRPTDLHGVH